MASMISFGAISLLIVWLLIVNQKNYWGDHKAVILGLKLEVVICLICLGLSYTSIELQKEKVKSHIEFEIGSLDEISIEQINSIDRGMAGRWDIVSKSNGKILKNIAIYLIPLSLFFFTGSLKRRLVLFFIYSQGYVLTESLTGLAKGLVERYRPFAYMTHIDIKKLSIKAQGKFLEDIVDYDIRNSFFSGDASIIAFGLVFFAMSYSTFYKQSKFKTVVWSIAIIGTILGCYFRTLSGKHFPTDVLLGGLVGAAIAYGIIRIHKNVPNSVELKE